MRPDQRIKRDQSAQALAVEIAKREMTPKQVCEFLGLSESGGRLCTIRLVNAGIIKAHHMGGTGAPAKRLVFCRVEGVDVDAFLASEGAVKANASKSFGIETDDGGIGYARRKAVRNADAQALVKRNWFGGKA